MPWIEAPTHRAMVAYLKPIRQSCSGCRAPPQAETALAEANSFKSGCQQFRNIRGLFWETRHGPVTTVTTVN